MSEHTRGTGPQPGEGFWNERYRSSSHLWSGNANPQLVAEVSDLGPGRALDVGCGEGADAIWLARRGWDVVAIDISSVALERAAQPARDSDALAAARIEWRQPTSWPALPSPTPSTSSRRSSCTCRRCRVHDSSPLSPRRCGPAERFSWSAIIRRISPRRAPSPDA